MDRKVLGRGLEALIPTEVQGFKEKVQSLKVQSIHPSRFQPRLKFAEEKILELAESIREKGVIQPIIVRAIEEGRFELIAGERRWRAVKSLGLDEIPAIVRRVSDADVLEMSIIENVQREELNPVDEAKAYRRLAQEFGFTQDAIASKVGKDKTSISNLLRILNLPESIQDYITQNLLTLGHAKALLSLTDEKRQMELCGRILKNGWSVRQVEGFTQKRAIRAPRSKVTTDKDIRDLEDRLRARFGTKVAVRHGKKRGSVTIEYYSLDDLDRILKLLGI